MSATKAAACFAALVLVGTTIRAAHAEQWVQASSADSTFWYDTDSVQLRTDHLVGVWISTGPTRTSVGTSGITIYPTYSVINCGSRTAGSKMSLDVGQALQSFAPNSGMGQLIAKLCSLSRSATAGTS
jgi:hypothetical protein